MTQVHCPGCRLRYSRRDAAKPTTCPACGNPLELSARGRDVVGYALVATDAPNHGEPPAQAHGVAALAAAVAALQTGTHRQD
jgi:hypothetical protein